MIERIDNEFIQTTARTILLSGKCDGYAGSDEREKFQLHSRSDRLVYRSSRRTN